jgi:hypothetical protein
MGIDPNAVYRTNCLANSALRHPGFPSFYCEIKKVG